MSMSEESSPLPEEVAPEEAPVEEEKPVEELDELPESEQEGSLSSDFVREKIRQHEDTESFEPEPETKTESESDKSKAKDAFKNLFNRDKNQRKNNQEGGNRGSEGRGPNLKDVINRIKEFRGNARQEQTDNFEAAKRNLEDAVASGDKPLIEAALKNLFDAAPEELELGKVYPSKSALQKRQGVDSLIGRALCILCDGSKTRRADFLKHLQTEKGYMWGYEEYLQNHPELDRISCRGEAQGSNSYYSGRVAPQGQGYQPEAEAPSSLVLNLKIYLKNNRLKVKSEEEEETETED